MAGSRFEPESNSCSEPPGLNKPEPPLGYAGTENRAQGNPEVIWTDQLANLKLLSEKPIRETSLWIVLKDTELCLLPQCPSQYLDA